MPAGNHKAEFKTHPRIDFGPDGAIGPGKIELLEQIERVGSLSKVKDPGTCAKAFRAVDNGHPDGEAQNQWEREITTHPDSTANGIAADWTPSKRTWWRRAHVTLTSYEHLPRLRRTPGLFEQCL